MWNRKGETIGSSFKETARSLKKSAGKRCVEHLKRELGHLELKKLNAARARLKVYEEN